MTNIFGKVKGLCYTANYRCLEMMFPGKVSVLIDFVDEFIFIQEGDETQILELRFGMRYVLSMLASVMQSQLLAERWIIRLVKQVFPHHELDLGD